MSISSNPQTQSPIPTIRFSLPNGRSAMPIGPLSMAPFEQQTYKPCPDSKPLTWNRVSTHCTGISFCIGRPGFMLSDINIPHRTFNNQRSISCPLKRQSLFSVFPAMLSKVLKSLTAIESRLDKALLCLSQRMRAVKDFGEIGCEIPSSCHGKPPTLSPPRSF